MRIVAIGDIGVVDGMIHIGDEAMFGAMTDAVRSRGLVGVTGISSNPDESAARYGTDAVAPLGFGGDRAANEERLTGILDSDDERAVAVRNAVRDADGVVIAGGGNMTSLWPQHVYERAALGRDQREGIVHETSLPRARRRARRPGQSAHSPSRTCAP